MDGGAADPTCSALAATWKGESARVRPPSRCFHAGDYGAVHVKILTEGGASDVDIYAPKSGDSWRWTPWAARG